MQLRTIIVVIVVLAAVVGGFRLNRVVDLAAQNDPWRTGFVVAAGIGLAVGMHRLQGWWFARSARRWDRDAVAVAATARRSEPDRAWVAPTAILAILAIFAVLGLYGGLTARDFYVRAYCEYGARSQAQLDGCMAHVTSEDINALDTHAARFARGETSTCLADSGPFCERATTYNTLDGPPGQ